MTDTPPNTPQKSTATATVTVPPSPSSAPPQAAEPPVPPEPEPQPQPQPTAHITTSDTLPLPATPPDESQLIFSGYCATEKMSRQLWARICYYNLTVKDLEGNNGDCLFDAIIYMLRRDFGIPDFMNAFQLRLQVAHFLCGKFGHFLSKYLKQVMTSLDISYYVLCKRVMYSGEYGGLETALFLRWGLRLTVSIISPLFDHHVQHRAKMADVKVVLAFNGSNHYMATGNFIIIII